jgi:hypothetical protein
MKGDRKMELAVIGGAVVLVWEKDNDEISKYIVARTENDEYMLISLADGSYYDSIPAQYWYSGEALSEYIADQFHTNRFEILLADERRISITALTFF